MPDRLRTFDWVVAAVLGLPSAGALPARGFAKRRGLARMRLGPPIGGSAPESLCAIAGPAVG